MVNYDDEEFKTMTIETDDSTITGLFSQMRVNPHTIPANKYQYEIRHSDDDDSIPATIENDVTVNFYGTLITDEFLDINDNDCIDIDDYGFTD